MNNPISEDKKCPNCGSDRYVISIFGSICPVCLYDPRKDGEPNPTPDTSDNELDKALNKLKIALTEPDFIKTLILIWVVMAGTIFVLWAGGALK